MDRRRLLQLAPSVLAASSIPLLSTPVRAAAKVRLGAALLVPTSGEHAALGRSMERAAALVQGANDGKPARHGAMTVFDTGGTAAGAAHAAIAARKAGASIIFGPVFAAEVQAVLRAIPRDIPVVTFSNDAALVESGAFLLGLTARQSITAILGYAAQRGVRRVAITGAGDGWSTQARAVASTLAPGLGLTIVDLPAGASLANVPADAVLASDAATLASLAPQATAQGLQLLGAFQGLDLAPDIITRLDGAWIAAPDPVDFAGFVKAYEQRNGSTPGMIAALAYDAAGIATQLLQGGGTDRSALLASSGFRAVCGRVRFHDDGSAARSLAILQAAQGQLRTVATWPA